MSSTGSKSMRVPSFDGKKAAFQMWWTKFRAFASVNKFAKAISETADPNLPLTADAVIDETTTTGVMQAAALARNNLAMSMFTIAFTSEKLMVLVYKCASDEWPNGTVHELVTLLTKKYMPKDMMSRVELRQELQAVKMNKLEDPANLFEKLSSIRNKFSKMKIDDEELIAIAISKAPREYAGVITSEQRAKGNLLDLDDLEETMCQQYISLVYRLTDLTGRYIVIGSRHNILK